jgi:cytochrome c biogenesis protein CcmG/thiol:disulfide interchange protein DsbE
VLADDVALASTVLPAWMGIQFRQARDEQRKTLGLADGAASVQFVYPDSPAAKAGLAEGDVVLGPPDAPFVEKEQIREWTMRSPPDVPAALEIVRDGTRRALTIVPATMPQKWPSLPGPPKVGTPAPPVRLGKYRGDPPATLADGKPRLLFFWATWCAICKSAVPELLAFEGAGKGQVVAITDETAAELDPFFAARTEPFPALVASDENRRAFLDYGVSGTPTFVLVDGAGVVRAAATGYLRTKGLPIDGWHWAGVDTGP